MMRRTDFSGLCILRFSQSEEINLHYGIKFSKPRAMTSIRTDASKVAEKGERWRPSLLFLLDFLREISGWIRQQELAARQWKV